MQRVAHGGWVRCGKKVVAGHTPCTAVPTLSTKGKPEIASQRGYGAGVVLRELAGLSGVEDRQKSQISRIFGPCHGDSVTTIYPPPRIARRVWRGALHEISQMQPCNLARADMSPSTRGMKQAKLPSAPHRVEHSSTPPRVTAPRLQRDLRSGTF